MHCSKARKAKKYRRRLQGKPKLLFLEEIFLMLKSLVSTRIYFPVYDIATFCLNVLYWYYTKLYSLDHLLFDDNHEFIFVYYQISLLKKSTRSGRPSRTLHHSRRWKGWPECCSQARYQDKSLCSQPLRPMVNVSIFLLVHKFNI